MYKRYILLFGGLLLLAHSAPAQESDSPYMLRFTRTRQPAFNLSRYKIIGVGDLTGPAGTVTPSSMNLTDGVTTKLLEKGSHEILDHTALKQLEGSKSAGANHVVDERALTALAKKTQSAVLVTGRIQSDKVNQAPKSSSHGDAACPTQYWRESFGDFTVQVKLFDVATAKLLYAEVVKIPMVHSSEKACAPVGKLDEEQIQREAAAAAAELVTHLLLPYEEHRRVELQKPALSGAFKDLKVAVTLFNSGDHAQALQMLGKYTTDTALKDKMRALAFYNYGLGLYIDGQPEQAKAQFLQAFALVPTEPAYKIWANNMDKEQPASTTVKRTP